MHTLIRRAAAVLPLLAIAACADPASLTAPDNVRLASSFARNFPLAFSSGRDGNAEIYKLQSDGTAIVRLTNDASVDSRPAWAPNGQRLAFVSRRAGGDQDIFLMADDGTGVVAITDNGVDDGQPSWSTNTSRLAFQSMRDGNSELYVMRTDGTNVVRLTNDPASDMYPAWSPKTDEIVFQRVSAGAIDIWSVRADGTGLRRLTTMGASNPTWFPDGQRIAFVAPVAGVSQIFVMNLATGAAPVQLTTSAGAKYYPAVSVDGLTVAFSSNRNAQDFDIWSIEATGANEVAVSVAPGNDVFPTWR